MSSTRNPRPLTGLEKTLFVIAVILFAINVALCVHIVAEHTPLGDDHGEGEAKAQAIAIDTVAAPKGTSTIQVGCKPFKDAVLDPIAHTAHLHTFYGVKGMTNSTTAAQMLKNPSTCSSRWDHSSFWHPKFRDPSGQLRTTNLSWYLANRTNQGDPFTMVPQGLEIVGNEGKVDTNFRCGTFGEGNEKDQSVPYGCNLDFITARVIFPDCWDSKSVRWDDGAHMRESVQGNCPQGYKRIAEPRFTVRIDNTPRIQKPLEVSMGNGEWMAAQDMYHGDIKFVFNRTAFETVYKRCVINGPAPLDVCQQRLRR